MFLNYKIINYSLEIISIMFYFFARTDRMLFCEYVCASGVNNNCKHSNNRSQMCNIYRIPICVVIIQQ